MRKLFVAVAVASTLVLVASVASAEAATQVVRRTSAPIPCEALTAQAIPNTTITNVATVPASGPLPATCRVHATVTHPPSGDTVNIDIWMPVDGWNGRFQGVGGGGYVGGFPQALAGPVSIGYAAGSTDTGHVGGSGTFALDADGQLNWQLIKDFSYLGIHDMTVVGKKLTTAFYGRAPHHSYWNGCSTGGRQGLAEAQRYPKDYDGILSAAPAINWSQFIPAEFWPELVMLREGNFLPQCKFSAFQAGAIAACDAVGDGVQDGVIGDPSRCDFDPRTLIGVVTPCGTITAQDAAVVAKIVAGPRTTGGHFLWYGLTPGTSFTGLANTVTTNGVTTGAPFPIALTHLGIWTLRDPTWDWTTTTYERYDRLFLQSFLMYNWVIGTSNPDLRDFKRSGGKVLIWHGQADQLIFPQGTVQYYERVKAIMGGAAKTEDFARLFMAPGVAHCAGGPGPQPVDPLSVLVDWVEQGHAPDALTGINRDASGTVVRSRPICMYPKVAAYQGTGDINDASNYACRRPSTT